MAKNINTDNWKESIDLLDALSDKYSSTGQDFTDYLNGLIYSRGLSYWDYINLNSLVGLQNPKTDFPDEVIFIIYHQITELYFKLIKHELEILTKKEFNNHDSWLIRIKRCTNYVKSLCSSFGIMFSGLDRKEFGKFRMSLLPASGFQSVQFREIEIYSTNLSNLLSYDNRDKTKEVPSEILYSNMYWKNGGIDKKTGEKTMTLLEFEKEYDVHLLKLIKENRFKNLNYLFSFLEEKSDSLNNALREYDEMINVFWKLSHLLAASQHLPKSEKGTGGTNWREYLPVKFQRIQFFPQLWSEEEKEEWGKSAVLQRFNSKIKDKWEKAN